MVTIKSPLFYFFLCFEFCFIFSFSLRIYSLCLYIYIFLIYVGIFNNVLWSIPTNLTQLIISSHKYLLNSGDIEENSWLDVKKGFKRATSKTLRAFNFYRKINTRSIFVNIFSKT